MRIPKIASRDQKQANYRHLVMDMTWYGLAIPATDRFLSIYAIRLGADANQLTWLAALPALMLLISATWGTWWVKRYTDSGKSVLWPGFGQRLTFLLPALTPFMPHNFQIPWLILSLTLPAVTQGISSVAFLVMFREAIDDESVPSLLGHRSLALNITVGLSGLALGVWLEHITFPLNYQLMFVTAFAITLISLWHLSRIRVTPKAVPAPQTERRPSQSPWRSPGFQTVAFIIVLTHLTFFSVRALIPLHLVNNLGAGEEFVSLFTLAELVGGGLITFFAKGIVKRLGNRGTIAFAMMGTGLGALLISATHNLALTLLASAITGATWTLVANGIFAFFTEKTPVNDLVPYTTAYNQIVFVAMFIGPMVGQLLNNLGLSLVMVILAGAVLRVAAGVLTQAHPRLWVARAMQLTSSILS